MMQINHSVARPFTCLVTKYHLYRFSSLSCLNKHRRQAHLRGCHDVHVFTFGHATVAMKSTNQYHYLKVSRYGFNIRNYTHKTWVCLVLYYLGGRNPVKHPHLPSAVIHCLRIAGLPRAILFRRAFIHACEAVTTWMPSHVFMQTLR